METIKDQKTGLQVTIPVDDPYYQQLAKVITTRGISNLPDYNLIKWCEQYLSADNVFIDIGSGIGLFSLLLSTKCKEIQAFDPVESLITCLAVASSMNNYYNIHYNKVALLNKDSSIPLYKGDKGITTSGFLAKILQIDDINVQTVHTVKSSTLDSFNLQHVGLLNIEADGSELNVLLGSIMTLLNNNFPPILIKIRGDEWYKEEKELVFAQLRNCGYTIHPVGGCPNRYLASDHSQHKSAQQIKAAKEQEKQELHLQETIQLFAKQQTEKFTWYEWYLMSRHYRLKSENQLSYDCTQRALTFVIPEEKKYLVWEEVSIVTCYLNKKEEGYQAADIVTMSEHAPFSTVNLAMKNQSFYMQALPLTNVVTISHPVDANYVTSSAAIIPKDNGFLLNVRAVNYELTKQGHYVPKDVDNIIRTRNYLLDVDNELKTTSVVELLDSTDSRKYPGRVHGIEDLRLFAPGEFFCTCLEVNKDNIAQMCYGQFTEDGTVTKLLPLQVSNKLQCEKNWLPLYIKDVLHMIYTVSPLRLYSVNTDTGAVTLIKEIDLVPDKNIDFFRGSASLIEHKDGWLGTIHQVHHDSRRMYFHRFIWFNSKFTELKYSRVFFFESPNVEFNLSICHSPNGLLVPYSVNDACTKIGTLPYEVLDTLI